MLISTVIFMVKSMVISMGISLVMYMVISTTLAIYCGVYCGGTTFIAVTVVISSGGRWYLLDGISLKEQAKRIMSNWTIKLKYGGST